MNPLCYALQGRLVLSSSGWYLLEVPNDLGNGLFKALNEPGVEQPTSHSERYNAHVSVIRPEELEEIGGPDKVTQRGQTFSFNIGPVREIINPAGWSEVSKVWAADIMSPSLMAMRRGLGLGPPKYPFHLTIAVRKRTRRAKVASIIHDWAKLASDTRIQKSPVHGKGLFAAKDFSTGETILPAVITRHSGKDGKSRWEQSDEARYTNHDTSANATVKKIDDKADLVASRDIDEGEEIFVNYDEVSDKLGPGFYYTYKGKEYGNTSESGAGTTGPRGICDAGPTACAIISVTKRIFYKSDAGRDGSEKTD